MAKSKSRATRPTIKMVAAAAGVSTSTVSRAFSRPEVLLPSTVSRVRQAAAQLGYVPDHSARALRTGTRGTIGLVVPDIANAFFPPLIRSVQAAAGTLGLATVIGDTDEDPAKEAPLIRKLARQTDGVILSSSRMADEEIRGLTEELPLVLVNREVEAMPCVLIDSGVGVREAVAHLAELGHDAVAYLAGPAASWSDRQRRTALRATAEERGLRPMILPHRRPEPGAGRDATGEVLEADVTAVIAFDDILAQGLLTGLAERGLRVPGDISVVGCDDTIAPYTTPPLTSVRALTAQAGEEAVAILAHRIRPVVGEKGAESDGSIDLTQRVRVASSLVRRGTTGVAHT